jgi:hypothetical protein
MKKLWCVICAAALLCCAGGLVMAQSSGSAYYVSAQGDDDNDGLTEATAFKTLLHAVVEAAKSDTIKTVTVIGTLNQASEGHILPTVFFIIAREGEASIPILITGIPASPSERRAVLSASGTQKICVDVSGSSRGLIVRFEHIEISGSAKTGLEVLRNTDVTLGPGAVVRNNSGGGVFISRPKDELRDKDRSGHLTLDGGIVENNTRENSGGGIFVGGAFTMKQGSVRNKTAGPDEGGISGGGGICIYSKDPVSIEGGDITGNTAGYGGGINIEEGSVTMSGGSVSGNTAGAGGGIFIAPKGSLTMSGGSISNNTATRGVGGVIVYKGATFNQQGGEISGNTAPSDTRADTHNIFREQ